MRCASQKIRAPKERRRLRAEKRLSKRVFWRVRFFSAPLRFALKTPKTLRGQRRNGLSKNTLLDNRFSARRLRRSFGAPPENATLATQSIFNAICALAEEIHSEIGHDASITASAMPRCGKLRLKMGGLFLSYLLSQVLR